MASAMLKIDPEAHFSMWEDLQMGRTTEIAYWQGAVITLARHHRLEALLCAPMMKAIQVAELVKAGSPKLDPAVLR